MTESSEFPEWMTTILYDHLPDGETVIVFFRTISKSEEPGIDVKVVDTVAGEPYKTQGIVSNSLDPKDEINEDIVNPERIWLQNIPSESEEKPVARINSSWDLPIRLRIGDGEEKVIGTVSIDINAKPATSIADMLRETADELESSARTGSEQ